MVTNSELQKTTSVKFPYPPCLLWIGLLETLKRIGQPCGQYTVSGHVAVIWQLWFQIETEGTHARDRNSG
jgi:hypothetical protein